MIKAIRQGLSDDSFDVAISRLCRWFESLEPNGAIASVAGQFSPKRTSDAEHERAMVWLVFAFLANHASRFATDWRAIATLVA